MSLETEIEPLGESIKKCQELQNKIFCLSTEDKIIMYVLLHFWIQFKNFSWRAQNGKYPEMEFLNISLTKNSIHLLHAVHNTFCWQILQKTILFFGFKNPRNKKTRVYSWIASRQKLKS